MSDLPRGLRNCDPGNIRHSDTVWKGQAAEQSDPDFVTFESPVFGLRALALILLNYQRKHGLKTVFQIVNRWAPPSENDTNAYVSAVAYAMKSRPDDPIDLENLAVLARLVSAIVYHENGSCPYPQTLIANAVTLAAAHASP